MKGEHVSFFFFFFPLSVFFILSKRKKNLVRLAVLGLGGKVENKGELLAWVIQRQDLLDRSYLALDPP